MRAYYHPVTDVYTPIKTNEKIKFPIRFDTSVPISERKELKKRLMSCIENHSAVVFMHPSHRKQGINYLLTGTSVIEEDFMKNILQQGFIGKDAIVLIIGTAIIRKFESSASFGFSGYFENRTPFSTRIRVSIIDDVLSDIQ